jgi:hypothetical protein
MYWPVWLSTPFTGFDSGDDAAGVSCLDLDKAMRINRSLFHGTGKRW